MHEDTIRRDGRIREYFANRNRVINIVWECDVKQMLNANSMLGNPEMIKFFDSIDDTTPFDTREILKGGIF